MYSAIAYLFLGLLLVSEVRAMDMSGSSSSSSSETMRMMIPYLHFTGGDYLFFDTLAPNSKGAIAGACIALVVLATLERAVAGVRGIFALHVLHHQKSLFQRNVTGQFVHTRGDVSDVGKIVEIEGSTSLTSSRTSPACATQPLPAQRKRSMAPLLWRYELARGGLFILQSFFLYAIMLAVMSFNAAYIISIIVGTGIGEVLFGRFTVEQNH